MAKRKAKRFTETAMKKAKAKKAPKKESATGAPRCKVCTFRHWGREPHIFTKDLIVLDDIKSTRRTE
jgi:hypothetical protein